MQRAFSNMKPAVTLEMIRRGKIHWNDYRQGGTGDSAETERGAGTV